MEAVSSMSEATQTLDPESVHALEPVAELLHDDCALELERAGDDADVYTFVDGPQEEITDDPIAHNEAVTEALYITRKRARHIFEAAQELGIDHFLRAAGFIHDQIDEDEDTFTVPRAEALNAFRAKHPGLIALGWHEESRNERSPKETILSQIANEQALLNDGRSGNEGLIYGYHDHVEHGPGYALMSPMVGELLVDQARELFLEYLDMDDENDLGEVSERILGFAKAYDHYTADTIVAMQHVENGAEQIAELDDESTGILVHLAPAMERAGLTRDDVVADIAAHTQRLREFEPDAAPIAA